MTESGLQLRLLDGQLQPSGVPSRAELLGQGLFETLYWNGSTFPLLAQHEQRLRQSAEWLGYDADQVWSAFGSQWAAHGKPACDGMSAMVRFQWTHQQTARGYGSVAGTAVTLWQVSQITADPVQTLDRLVLAARPMPDNPGPPCKHSSRVDQVVAAREGGSDQLRCDQHGFLREGLSGNLVFWRHGHWYTPGLQRHGVAGTLLAWLCQHWADQGQPVLSGDFPPRILHSAEVVLLTNALGARVVNGFEGVRYNRAHPVLQTTLQTIRQLYS